MSTRFKAFNAVVTAVGFSLLVAACGGSTTRAAQATTDKGPVKQTSATVSAAIPTAAVAATPARTTASTTAAASPIVTVTSDEVCHAFTPSRVSSLISYPVTRAKPNTATIIKTVGCDYDNDIDGLVLGIQITSLPGVYDDDKTIDSSAGIEPLQVGQEGFFSARVAQAEFKVGEQAVVIAWTSVGDSGPVSADAARTASTNLGKAVIAKFFPAYAK